MSRTGTADGVRLRGAGGSKAPGSGSVAGVGPSAGARRAARK